MTEEEKIAWIKEKLVPLFSGMNAEDALDILNENMRLRGVVLSQFSLPSNR